MKPSKGKKALIKDLVLGDPISTLVAIFNTVHSEYDLCVAYTSDMEFWHQGSIRIPKDAGNIFQDLTEDGFDGFMENNWTVGSLISVVRNGNTITVCLDWESSIADNVAVLLEVLPRLASGNHDGTDIDNQYKYRVSKKRIANLFETLMDCYLSNTLSDILSSAETIESLLIPYTILGDGDYEDIGEI